MGLVKKIWVENGPEHEDYRKSVMADASEYISQFEFRIAERRFKLVDGNRVRDGMWPAALAEALKEISSDCITVNSGLLFRSEKNRDQVKTLAESYYNDQETLFAKWGAGKKVKPPEHKNPNTPTCPDCSWPMKKRRARQGFYAGQKFWGCMRYPVCKGLRDID